MFLLGAGVEFGDISQVTIFGVICGFMGISSHNAHWEIFRAFTLARSTLLEMAGHIQKKRYLHKIQCLYKKTITLLFSEASSPKKAPIINFRSLNSPKIDFHTFGVKKQTRIWRVSLNVNQCNRGSTSHKKRILKTIEYRKGWT